MPKSQTEPDRETGSLQRIVEAQQAEDAALDRLVVAREEVKDAKAAYEDARDHRRQVIRDEAGDRPLLAGQEVPSEVSFEGKVFDAIAAASKALKAKAREEA